MTIGLIVAAFVLFDMVVFGAILPSIVGSVWGPIASRHPPVAPAPDAVWREFQSFQAEMVNLGWCVHVGVDSEFLHLRPAWLGRVFRVRPASVPWSGIEYVKGRGRWAKVRIASVSLKGPAWCLDLAADHAGPAPRA